MVFGKTIPVRIHPLFWLMAAAIGYINSMDLVGTAVWIVVIFISVLVHEFGHALTAMAYGQKATIDLMALGGLTQREGAPLPLFREFMVVLNGPMAGFALFAVVYHFLLQYPNAPPLVTYGLDVAVWVNLFWTLINLLPIQPLDGGKLLIIAMEGIFGLRGVKVGLFASLVIAVVLGLVCFAFGILLPGAIFMMFAFESYRAWQGSMVMTERDRDQELQQKLRAAEQLMATGKREEAEVALKDIRSKSSAGFLYLASTEALGQLAAEKGDYQQAYELLHSIESHLEGNSLALLHQLAYRSGNWQHAVAVGDRAYQISPSYEVALLNALSHAILGEVQATIGWLRCAVQEGLPNIQQVLKQTEFDKVRSTPQFQDFEREEASRK